MDIQEKAHNYAIKALEPNIKMLEEAYLAGYNASKGIVSADGIEYIDLGLPSGTLWATKLVGQNEEGTDCTRMIYADALKYSLPTIEQFYELRHLPKMQNGNKITYYGINGNLLVLPNLGYIEKGAYQENWLEVWLKDTGVHNNKSQVGCFSYNRTVDNLYIGDFLPILLVKQKSEL